MIEKTPLHESSNLYFQGRKIKQVADPVLCWDNNLVDGSKKRTKHNLHRIVVICPKGRKVSKDNSETFRQDNTDVNTSVHFVHIEKKEGRKSPLIESEESRTCPPINES